MILLHDGLLYIGSHVAGAINGDRPARLTALRARDGVRQWQRKPAHFKGLTHLVADGRLLFADSNAGGGSLYALDARTAAVQWVFGARTGISNRLITASGGLVYARDTGEPRAPPGFSALDARTGAVRWSYRQPVVALMTAEGGRVVAVVAVARTGAKSVRVLEAEGGRLTQTWAHAKGVSLLALSDQGIVYMTSYFGQNDQLYAIRLHDGTELWETGTHLSPGPHHVLFSTQLAVDLERLYYVQLLQAERIIEVGALNASTGAQLWRWQTASGYPSDVGANSLIAYQDKVYVTTTQGLLAFRASDGHLLWQALPQRDLSLIPPGAAAVLS